MLEILVGLTTLIICFAITYLVGLLTVRLFTSIFKVDDDLYEPLMLNTEEYATLGIMVLGAIVILYIFGTIVLSLFLV